MIILEEDVDTDQETVRLPVRVIRDRRLVPELRDRALKAVRCHYTEDCRREVSSAETPKTIVGINLSALEVFENSNCSCFC